ncbi:DUF7507 domain-containing protein [Microbacterium phyllosphaerae]
MAESVIRRAQRQRSKRRDLSIEGVRRRTGWVGLLTALVVAFATLAPTPAMAAATAITLTSSASTAKSGTATTFTMTVSCSTDGGCTDSTVTIPTTTITGTPAITDFGAWLGNSSCAGVTRTASAGQVVFNYGTLPTGSKQCTFTVTAPEYKTLNNTVATITPTLASSNSESSTATPVAHTITAGYNVSLTNGTPARVIAGLPFEYTVTLYCGLNGGYTGDIGVSAISMSSTLPANFEYQSYRLRTNVPGAVSYDPASRVFSYSDPTGTACGNPPLNNGNQITIYVSGKAATNGVPNPVGSQVCNSSTASWTYIDGTPGSATTTTVCSPVITLATTVAKSTSAPSTLSNIGAFTAADAGARASHTYPGDWDRTGASAYYDITMNTVPATTNAGVSYDIQDPMPCLTNGANNNYSSNAVGAYCQSPGFIPTLVVPFGFTVTTADAITVIRTDGSSASIPYTTGRGWVIPTTPAIAQIDVPPFTSQGTNTAATMRLRILGYAASDVPAPAVLTNRVSSTPYLSEDLSAPIVAAQTATSRLQVEVPPANDAAFIYPGLTTSQVGATCNATVSLNSSTNGAYSNRIEMPTAPSSAVYIDYLAPAGAVTVSPATTAFSFASLNSNGSGGKTYTSVAVAPTTTQNYNGTGRTLVRWTIPAGVVTVPGYYNIRSAAPLSTLALEPGCAGTYTSDITVGYGAPIAQCYFNNYVSAHIEPAPMYPFGTADLRSNASPITNNYCGYSSNIQIAAINPGFTVDKTVQGNLDAAPIGGGGTGHVSIDGGEATYAVTFKNTGESTLANPVMYDLLPRVGDTRASSTAPRGSQFAVTLTDVDALPANLQVAYSQAINPCRPEVLTPNAGCVDDWTTTAPASLASVTALKFVYSGSIRVGSSFSATYSVSTPPAAAGNVAWNSIGTNVTAGDALVGKAESSLTGLQAQSAQPAITKTADRTTVDAVGQPVVFTFTVTNNTAVTLNDVRVTDALLNSAASSVAPTPVCSSLTTPAGSCSGASTTLAAGQSAIFTATYVTTQADLDHGSVSDQATATATPPTGPALSNSTGVVTVTAAQSGALTLSKTAQPGTVDSVGDVIDYRFTVTNSGNVTLQTLAIDETSFSGSGSLSAISCPTAPLAPGATAECTASYPVTQADLTAGAVENTATASAVDPGGTSVVSAESTARVAVDQVPSLGLVKSASPAGAAAYDAGQVITYSFVVTNTGNVPVTGITVDEVAFTGSDAPSAIDCPADALAPAAQFTCTATYTLTQDDVDAGSLTNTAQAAGTAPGGPVSSEESTVRTPQVAAASLTLTKTASTGFVNAAGEVVTYTFTVRNGGNVTVHDVAIEETAFSGSGGIPVVACPSDTLAPGQQLVCSAEYTVTQADMNDGGFENTARASALDTADSAVESEESTARVTANTAPALSVVKTADVTSYSEVGDPVEFSFLVTNTGNVAVENVEIAERLFTGSGTLSSIACPVAELAPAESTTCTSGYEVTQSDIDRGTIANTASSSAETRAGDPVLSDPSTVTVIADQSAALLLEKTVAPQDADAAGDEVVYTFRVTNAGNVTLSGLEIAETAFSGTGALVAPECESPLAPGDDVTCEVTYVLTQADVDAGEVSNTATATASASGTTVTSEESTALVSVARQPQLSLVKSADIADPEDIRAGDVITYSFVVTNVGNVTISDARVIEGEFSGTGVLGELTCESTDPLAPGDQLICALEYTVTQEDVDAGELSNTATAAGTGPGGTEPPISAPSTVELPAPANPGLTLEKTTEVTKIAAAGQLVGYTFTITNTGNTTARGVTVSEDSFSGHGAGPVVACPSAEVLLPGEITVCAASYTVVAADLDGNALINTASAKSTAPDGDEVSSDPSTARIDDVVTAAAPEGSGLAITGGTLAWGSGILAIGLLIAGGLLLAVRRRRRRQQFQD